jgi:hypothetical protein
MSRFTQCAKCQRHVRTQALSRHTCPEKVPCACGGTDCFFFRTSSAPHQRYATVSCAHKGKGERAKARRLDPSSGPSAGELQKEAEARQLEALHRKARLEAAQASTYGPGLMGEALYEFTMQLMRRSA